MKNLSTLLVLVLVLTLSSCKNKKKREVEPQTSMETSKSMNSEKKTREKKIVVPMHSASNSAVMGEVTFTEKNGSVKMHGKFSGLIPNSTHAIHLHEKADCSASDGSSAGGHWNPTDEEHGKWGDNDGFHLGDIGNLKADKDGQASISFKTDKWCIECNDERKNIIGKSVIVHKDKDDFTSQPTGNAGARISCGEIKL